MKPHVNYSRGKNVRLGFEERALGCFLEWANTFFVYSSEYSPAFMNMFGLP